MNDEGGDEMQDKQSREEKKILCSKTPMVGLGSAFFAGLTLTQQRNKMSER